MGDAGKCRSVLIVLGDYGKRQVVSNRQLRDWGATIPLIGEGNPIFSLGWISDLHSCPTPLGLEEPSFPVDQQIEPVAKLKRTNRLFACLTMITLSS